MTLIKKPRKYASKNASVMEKMYSNLRWTDKPNRFIPHGISGLVFLVLGYYLTYCALLGHLELAYGAYDGNHKSSSSSSIWITAMFYIAGIVNAIGGYKLSPTAPKHFAPIFRMLSIMQISLVYWSIRFYPRSFFHLTMPMLLFRLCDVIFTIGIYASLATFVMFAAQYYNSIRAVSITIMIGAFGLSTLAFHPTQVMYDPQWMSCTHERYPLEGLGLTAYAFIPAMTISSTIAFLATVYNRNIISGISILAVAFVFIAITLVWTALSMEWFLADVSTQKLIIPCRPVDDESSWESWLIDTLDLSAKARYLFWTFGGVEVPVSQYAQLLLMPPK